MTKELEHIYYIIKLEKEGKIYESIGLLYEFIDNLIENKEENKLNSLLGILKIQELGIQLTTAVLTFTLRHKEKLPKRFLFLTKTRTWLEKVEPTQRIENLLKGLD